MKIFLNKLVFRSTPYVIASSGTNVINIKNDINVGTDGSLIVGNTATPATLIKFNGTVPQTISLNGNGIFTTGAGTTMTVDNALALNGDMSLNGIINISVAKSLTVQSGKTLTLTSGTSLNNAGVLLNLGTITNNGTLSNTGGYVITVTSNDDSMGTVSGTVSGSDVSLLAAPKSGYKFINWTESPTGEIGTDAVLPTFTATSDRTLVANFSVSTSIESSVENNVLAIVDGKRVKATEKLSGIEIYNSVGQLIILQKNFDSVITLETSGVYFVKMSTFKGVKVQKILIK